MTLAEALRGLDELREQAYEAAAELLACSGYLPTERAERIAQLLLNLSQVAGAAERMLRPPLPIRGGGARW